MEMGAGRELEDEDWAEETGEIGMEDITGSPLSSKSLLSACKDGAHKDEDEAAVVAASSSETEVVAAVAPVSDVETSA